MADFVHFLAIKSTFIDILSRNNIDGTKRINLVSLKNIDMGQKVFKNTNYSM